MASQVDILLKLNYTEKGLKSVLSGLTSFMGKLTTAAGLYVSINQLTQSIETMAKYEQSMANVKATLNATSTEMLAVSNSARKAGESSIFSAEQIAEGQLVMAQAGLTAKQIIEGTNSAIELATAGSLSFAEAVEAQKAAYVNFGIQFSDMERVNNAFVTSANSSTMSVKDITTAMKYIGPVAQQFGLTLEQTTSYLAAMANAGIKASMGGTALRTIMNHLANASRESSKMFEGYGISVYDVNGKLKSASELLDELSTKKLTLSDLFVGFEQRGGPAAQALLQELGWTKDLVNQIGEDVDSASRVATAKVTTLVGAWKIFNNVLRGSSIAAGEGGLTGVLRDFLVMITDKIREINPYIESLSRQMVSAFKDHRIGSWLFTELSLAWDNFKKLVSDFWNGESGSTFRNDAFEVFLAVGNFLGKTLVDVLNIAIASFATGMKMALDSLSNNRFFSLLKLAGKGIDTVGSTAASVVGGRNVSSGNPEYIDREKQFYSALEDFSKKTGETFDWSKFTSAIDDLAKGTKALSLVAEPSTIKDYINNAALALRNWQSANAGTSEGHYGQGYISPSTSDMTNQEYYNSIKDSLSFLSTGIDSITKKALATLEGDANRKPGTAGSSVQTTTLPLQESIVALTAAIKTKLASSANSVLGGFGISAGTVPSDIGDTSKWNDAQVLIYAAAVGQVNLSYEELVHQVDLLTRKPFGSEYTEADIAVNKLRGDLAQAAVLQEKVNNPKTDKAPVDELNNAWTKFKNTTLGVLEAQNSLSDAMSNAIIAGAAYSGLTNEERAALEAYNQQQIENYRQEVKGYNLQVKIAALAAQQLADGTIANTISLDIDGKRVQVQLTEQLSKALDDAAKAQTKLNQAQKGGSVPKTRYEQTKVDYQSNFGGENGLGDATKNYQDIGESIGGGFMDWTNQVGSAFNQLAQTISSVMSEITSGITSGIMGWIQGTETFTEAVRQMAVDIIQTIIQMLVQMGVQYAINWGLETAGFAAKETVKTGEAAAGATARTTIAATEGTGIAVGAAIGASGVVAAEAIKGAAVTAGTATVVTNNTTQQASILETAWAWIVNAAAATLSGLSEIPIVGWIVGIAAMAAIIALGASLIGGMATGGQPEGGTYAGKVVGPGTRTSDTAGTYRLSADEYVVRGNAAAAIGYDNLDYMNTFGRFPETARGFATGGSVGDYSGSASTSSSSGAGDTKMPAIIFVNSQKEAMREQKRLAGYDAQIVDVVKRNKGKINS